MNPCMSIRAQMAAAVVRPQHFIVLILERLDFLANKSAFYSTSGVKKLFLVFKTHLGTHTDFATAWASVTGDSFGLASLPALQSRLFDKAGTPIRVYLDDPILLSDILDDLLLVSDYRASNSAW